MVPCQAKLSHAKSIRSRSRASSRFLVPWPITNILYFINRKTLLHKMKLLFSNLKLYNGRKEELSLKSKDSKFAYEKGGLAIPN